MRLSFLLILLCYFVSTNLQAQRKLEPSVETVTKTYELGDYSRISVSDDFKVSLTTDADEELIELEVNENLLEYVDIENDGETLRIRRRGNLWVNGRMTLNLTIKTGHSIEELKANGDAQIRLENTLTTKELSVRIASDATLEGAIAVEYLRFQAASDAKASLSGAVGKMDANLASDAILDGRDMEIEDLVIRLASDAVAKVKVNKTLDASAASDAKLRYAGSPKIISTKTSSDATIRRM